MTQITKILILTGTTCLLLACGGGGSGGGKSGGAPQAFDVEQTLPPRLGGRAGDYGDLHFQAIGSEDVVTLSYRPTGGKAVAELSLSPGQSELLSLPAGIAPDIGLVSTPAGQYCHLSVDWQFQVMPREERITVDCFDRITVPENIDAYPLQWIALPGAGLADIQASLRVELIQDSTAADISFVVENDTLLFMMPDDVVADTGQLHVWHGGTRIAEAQVNITPIPQLNMSTFLDNWFLDLFEGVEDALPPGAVSPWQGRYNQEVQDLRQRFDALSGDEKELAARYLWANLNSMEHFLNPPLLPARRGAFGLTASSVSSCGVAAIKLAGFTAATVFVGWGSVELLGSLGLTGPVAGVVAVGGGIAVAALMIKATDKARDMAKDMVEVCAIFRGLLGGNDNDGADNPAARVAGRATPRSNQPAVTTRTLHLVHGQPYETALRVRRVLPPNAIASLRGLQEALRPVSGFFDEGLDWLYLFDFDARLPLTPASGLSLYGTGMAANTLGLNGDSNLSIELVFTGQPLPERPVPFQVTGEATAYDAWLGKDVPVSLDLRGNLSGEPPVAFDVMFNIMPNEVFKLTVPMEFATSAIITRQPRHGRIFAGVGLGEFHYFPDEDNYEPDSFEYEAINGFGTERGLVTLTVNDHCKLNDGSDWMWTCTYNFRNEGVIFEVYTGTSMYPPWGRSDKHFMMRTSDGELILQHVVNEQYFNGTLDSVRTLKGWRGGDGHQYEEERMLCYDGVSPCSSVSWVRSLVPLTITHPFDAASVYRYFKPYLERASGY